MNVFPVSHVHWQHSAVVQAAAYLEQLVQSQLLLSNESRSTSLSGLVTFMEAVSFSVACISSNKTRLLAFPHSIIVLALSVCFVLASLLRKCRACSAMNASKQEQRTCSRRVTGTRGKAVLAQYFELTVSWLTPLWENDVMFPYLRWCTIESFETLL